MGSDAAGIQREVRLAPHGAFNSADRAFTMPKSAGRTCASSSTRSRLEREQCGEQGRADFSLGELLDRRVAKILFSSVRKWLTCLGRQKARG